MKIAILTDRISKHFRRRRMSQFQSMFDLTGHERIIDIGGYEANWLLISAEPDVLLVNIEDDNWYRGRFSKVQGDGCDLKFNDNSFDLAYSNSVVEHVGSWEKQKAFAAEIRRVAPRYYVQTPYRYFPIEPHLLGPFFQFLPKNVAKRVARWGTLHGLVTRGPQSWYDWFVDETRLLTKQEMRELFPDATLITERAFGFTKSIIAVKF